MRFKTVLAALLACAAICASCSPQTGGPSRFAEQTTSVLHVYADGTNGSDTYDGTAATNTPGTLVGPKKTLTAVIDLVPYLVKHNTAVHLAGTFDTQASATLERWVYEAATLIVDGGPTLTTVVDNGGNPWTADVHSASSIGLTTLGWTPDQYAGYWVQIVDGPCAGQTRRIHSHTATTITPGRNWSGDPGLANFRVVRPTTTLTSSTSATPSALLLSTAGRGYTVIQNLYLAGTQSRIAGYGLAAPASRVIISHVVHDGTYLFPINFQSANVALNSARYSTATFAGESANTYSAAGASLRGAAATGFNATNSCVASLSDSYIKLGNVAAQSFVVYGGTRIDTLTLAMSYGTTSAMVYNSSGYAATRFGSSAVANGLQMFDCSLRVGAGVDFSSCTSHAIILNHSRLHLDGAVTGTGNTGAGVYAHSGSVVHIKDGAPPTLTGTVGDFSTNGTTQASTWAAIDAGTAVADSDEMTMAKQVP